MSLTGYRRAYYQAEKPGSGKDEQCSMVRVDLTRATVSRRAVCTSCRSSSRSTCRPTFSESQPQEYDRRLDIFTRLITDYGVEFERYRRDIRASCTRRSYLGRFRWPCMRAYDLTNFVFCGDPPSPDNVLSTLDTEEKLVFLNEMRVRRTDRSGLKITVNLQATDNSGIVAYKARKNAPAIELDRLNYYSPHDFWEIRRESEGKSIILDPSDFYILASREKVHVPPEFAAEMVAFDPSMGEFRIHYAGFFDPGFGYGASDIKGTRAVLEVRAHEVPFMIDHGQVVGRLVYSPLLAKPEKIYGVGIGSSYQQQALTLSKQFQK